MSEAHLCRLCISSCSDYKELYQQNGYHTEVYTVAVNYFPPMFLKAAEGNPHTIMCWQCWRYIHEFHSFRESILNTQTKFREKTKQVDGVVDDVEFISLADSELIDVKEMPNLQCIDENLAKSKENVSSVISDDSSSDDSFSDECEEPVGEIVWEGLNDETEDYDISLSELETLGTHLSSDDESSLKSEHNNETNIIKRRTKTNMVKNAILQKKSIDLHTELNTKSDNVPNTTTESIKGCGIVNKKCDDPINKVAYTKSKPKLRKTIKKRTIKQSDDLIAKWLPALECTVCGESCSTFTLLKDHFRQNHPNSKFYVVCCERKYVYRCNIAEHIRLHLYPNTYQCKECGICFSGKGNITVHRKTACKGMDDLISKWKTNLDCVVCSESYPRFSMLKQHFREKHPNEKFYVLCCGRIFLYRNQMEEHIRVHLNPNTYKCERCNRCFSRKRVLDAHLTRTCSKKKC